MCECESARRRVRGWGGGLERTSINSAKVKMLVVAVLTYYTLGHGAIVSPRSRNSVDYLAGVTGIDSCVNVTGASCENGASLSVRGLVYLPCHRLYSYDVKRLIT
jgi:hypothetical protein